MNFKAMSAAKLAESLDLGEIELNCNKVIHIVPFTGGIEQVNKLSEGDIEVLIDSIPLENDLQNRISGVISDSLNVGTDNIDRPDPNCLPKNLRREFSHCLG